MDESQVRELLAVAKFAIVGPVVVLVIGTGARQGEILALHWKDVDLTAGTVAIRYGLLAKTASRS